MGIRYHTWALARFDAHHDISNTVLIKLFEMSSAKTKLEIEARQLNVQCYVLGCLCTCKPEERRVVT